MSDRTKGTARILLVDDENAFHQQVQFAFGEDYNFDSVRDFRTALHSMAKNSFDLILLDLDLGDGFEEGIDRIAQVKENYPDIPLIVVTNDQSRNTIVKSMVKGANDFLYKGEYDKVKWKDKFEKHLKAGRLIAKLNKKILQLETPPFIGESPKIREIKESLAFIAKEPQNITLLIKGETGVGKEVAARFFHHHSLRKFKPFEAVNLSAIQDTLWESTLFGHKKGAFTGAIDENLGFFQQAEKGILFLDEIGEISKDIQVKLLRFLENKVIRMVGSVIDIKLDVQIVAATNRDLEAEVKASNFRSDFYQRLKVFPVEIPPLRKRKEDIPLILQHYLQLSPRNLKGAFTREAYVKLMDFDWPGNVRELTNSIDYMRLKQRMKMIPSIDLSCLPSEILQFEPEVTSIKENQYTNLNFEETIALTELGEIEKALSETYNRKGIAAEMLNMSADNLRYRVLKYHKKFPQLFDQFQRIFKVYKLEKTQS